ncbi:hypothetical protein [Bacillus sp. FJAT-27245]|nr:hypothetical protein [Bacillus sp. FJAT-27245]
MELFAESECLDFSGAGWYNEVKTSLALEVCAFGKQKKNAMLGEKM